MVVGRIEGGLGALYMVEKVSPGALGVQECEWAGVGTSKQTDTSRCKGANGCTSANGHERKQGRKWVQGCKWTWVGTRM